MTLPAPGTGSAPHDGRRFRAWRVRGAAVVGLLIAGLALGPAHAADQLVSGTVAPQVGIGLDAASTPSGTTALSITREQRGDTLYVTVSPAG